MVTYQTKVSPPRPTVPLRGGFAARRYRVAQGFSLGYLAVLVVVSLYPFDWETGSAPWFEFLSYPWPYYQRPFDVTVNVLAYLPYGFALARACRRGWRGFVLASLLTAATSLAIEIAQLHIPGRVASNLDLLSNACGGCAGALLATVPYFRRVGRLLRRWRERWVQEGIAGDYALMLVVLWFLTQLNPATPLFGVVVMPQGLPQPYVSPLTDPALFLFLLEAGGAMLNLAATLVFISAFLAHQRDTFTVLVTFLGLTLLLRLGAVGAMLKPMAWFAWINSQVFVGLLLGGFLTLLLTHAPRRMQMIGAWLLFACSLWVMAQWPLSGDVSEQRALFRWSYGHLTNLNALAEFTARSWPWVAMLCLTVGLFKKPAI